MQTEIIVALISFAGGAVGALSGASLTKYRIAQLEKKVEKHNNLVERIVIEEQNTKAQWKRIDEMRIKIDEIEKG